MNRTFPITNPDQQAHIFSANRAIWVVQALLAVIFLAHGLMFLFPPESVSAQMNEALPRWFQVFLGTSEVMAAVGLTVPALVRMHQRLMLWSALGTSTVLVSATLWHLLRREFSSAVITVVLLAMSVAVARARR